MDSDDIGTVFLVVVIVLLIFAFGMAVGDKLSTYGACELLAAQVSALDARLENGLCELQFEDGTWITQEKYFSDLFKETRGAK